MAEVDIYKILDHYGLEVTSNNKVCCPFHNERTPSLSIYNEGTSFYCFGCGVSGDGISFVMEHDSIPFKQAVDKVEAIIGEKVELGKGVGEKAVQKPTGSPMPVEAIKEFQKDKVFQNVGYRGIRKETDEFFRTLSKLDDQGNVIARYYPETKDGKLMGYKARNHPKDFTYGKVGKTGIDNDLSGQHLFKAGGKYILILGGEEDKSAAYQMFFDLQKSRSKGNDDYSVIPCVSPTSGENSAAKQCAYNYDFLDQYDNIIIGMDNDDAGIKAAEEIAKVLPKHKVKIAKWTRKDPNEMLKQGMLKQFSSDFWNAREYVDTGIKSGADALSEVKEFLTAPKIPLPDHMHRIQEAHRGGLKSSGFIGHIIADTSVGKTFVTDTLLNFWIPRDDLVPVIVSIERTAGEFMADLLSIFLAKNLAWFEDGQDAVDYLEQPEVMELVNSFIYDEQGKNRFYVIDERDGSLEVLQNKMQTAASKYGTSLFIIDPLTDILRSLGNDVQDDHMLWQKQQKKKGWKILNVLHTRKPSTDKDGKLRKVTEYDAYGSSSFVQSSDFNWVLNRDKMAEDSMERNTMSIDIPKVRGGTTGHITDLYYDRKTRKHYDLKDYLSGGNVYEHEGDDPVEEEVIIECETQVDEINGEELVFNTPK